MGAVRLPKILVLIIDDSFVGAGAIVCAGAGPGVQAGAKLGTSFSFFVPGLAHVTLIELRLALISYQDYHMLLLTLAGSCSPSSVPPAARWRAPLPLSTRPLALTMHAQPHFPRAASEPACAHFRPVA